MAAPGITVLKHNAPWGPFTREQIEDGLARGDFTVKYLAHTAGLKEWLPLGEVLDYVARQIDNPPKPLPPVPEPRDLPPIPPKDVAVATPPLTRPPILPAPRPIEKPVPVIEKIEPKPEPLPVREEHVIPASFFPRSIAFVIDCGILFLPVLGLYILGALCIEIPAWWRPIAHQTRIEEWELLNLNVKRLAWLVALGFGWIYGAGYEASRKQATIGKRWMGLKVIGRDGQRINFLHASGRYLAKYASALPCFLGFVAALFSSENLALHDRLSDTRVVRK